MVNADSLKPLLTKARGAGAGSVTAVPSPGSQLCGFEPLVRPLRAQVRARGARGRGRALGGGGLGAVTRLTPPRAQWRRGPAPPSRPPCFRAAAPWGYWRAGGRAAAPPPPPPPRRLLRAAGRQQWPALGGLGQGCPPAPSRPSRPAPRCPWRSRAAARLPPRDAAWTDLLPGTCGGRDPRPSGGRVARAGRRCRAPRGDARPWGRARGVRPGTCHPARGQRRRWARREGPGAAAAELPGSACGTAGPDGQCARLAGSAALEAAPRCAPCKRAGSAVRAVQACGLRVRMEGREVGLWRWKAAGVPTEIVCVGLVGTCWASYSLAPSGTLPRC